MPQLKTAVSFDLEGVEQCFFFTREKKNSTRENFQDSAREMFKVAEKKILEPTRENKKYPRKKKQNSTREKKNLPEKKKCKILPEKTQKVPEKKSGPKFLISFFSSFFCNCNRLILW